jgi:putative hydrolase of the HAD superfamily
VIKALLFDLDSSRRSESRARSTSLSCRKKKACVNPDAEIFRRTLARCGVAAREALFGGDHPVADIEGRTRAGLRTEWMFVPHWPPVIAGTPVMHYLSQVLELV